MFPPRPIRLNLSISSRTQREAGVRGEQSLRQGIWKTSVLRRCGRRGRSRRRTRLHREIRDAPARVHLAVEAHVAPDTFPTADEATQPLMDLSDDDSS